jgi:4,4'-diaponeurosporenoate glycosyltransferase
VARAGSTPARATTVVVPARDEAENLGRLLPSLAGSGLDVVVVDDHSSDRTASVAAAGGARVVAAPALPDGWTGKAWACATGASAATEGARLVFLDADTTLEPGGLDRILGEHDRRGGMVSVQPVHIVERPYERLSAWFNLVAMMGVDAFSPLRGRVRPTGAFGPCMVVDREVYHRAGGHAAVRGDVLDDVALARAVIATGGPVTLFGGEGVIRFRMYPRGLGQLVEGWTKNFAGGAAGTRPLTLLLVVAWMAGAIAAAVAPLTTSRAGVVLYAAYAAQLAVLFRRVGRFGVATAVLFPIPLAFFLAVFLRSIVLTFVRREVAWRGRRVRT